MNTEFQQKMAIAAGQQQATLSQQDKQKISSAYFKMFVGLTMTMWVQGKTLGAAWYAALQQMKSYVGTKDKNNPAAMYLNQVFSAHNTKWQQMMMTSKSKDLKLKLTPEKQAAWLQMAAKRTNDGMKSMTDLIKAHMPKQQKQEITPQTLNPQQKMQLLIWEKMRQNQQQHAA